MIEVMKIANNRGIWILQSDGLRYFEILWAPWASNSRNIVLPIKVRARQAFRTVWQCYDWDNGLSAMVERFETMAIAEEILEALE